MASDRKPLLIAVGNDHRGDDAIGPIVARRLRARVGDAARVVEVATEGTRLLDLWDREAFVIVVDAVTSGRPAGTVHRIEPAADGLPSSLAPTSTHGLSLAEAVTLGRTLGRMPRRLVVYGVEGARFHVGAPLSPEVAAAVPAVVDRIVDELAARGPLRVPVGGRADA